MDTQSAAMYRRFVSISSTVLKVGKQHVKGGTKGSNQMKSKHIRVRFNRKDTMTLYNLYILKVHTKLEIQLPVVIHRVRVPGWKCIEMCPARKLFRLLASYVSTAGAFRKSSFFNSKLILKDPLHNTANTTLLPSVLAHHYFTLKSTWNMLSNRADNVRFPLLIL